MFVELMTMSGPVQVNIATIGYINPQKKDKSGGPTSLVVWDNQNTLLVLAEAAELREKFNVLLMKPHQ